MKNPSTLEARRSDAARRKLNYLQNRERERINRKQWRTKNRAKKKLLDAIWQKRNKERANSRAAKWRRANPDKVNSFCRNRRARKASSAGFHTAADIDAIFRTQNGLCACGCSTSLADRNYEVDHILPISRGGSNWPSNIQLLTPSCNKSKNDKTMEEWMIARAELALINPPV